MKFAAKIREEMVPECAPHYLDYDSIKVMLKSPGLTERVLKDTLEYELLKTDDFTRGMWAYK